MLQVSVSTAQPQLHAVPQPSASRVPLYLDYTAPLNARVADLEKRLTLEEKVSLLGTNSPAIPRLSIPAYPWWNEALHGVARAGIATVFPQAIGMAATWDPTLVHDVAESISIEARAKYNIASAHGSVPMFYGITFFTPNVNIARDPRWGRTQETYGEDPVLTTAIGTAFVRGLQGDDARYLRAAATLKHFVAHSGPEAGRTEFDAIVTRHDLAATYLRQFRAIVEAANPASVMASYNELNGMPMVANGGLLNGTIRDEWDFQGYIVSDCNAIRYSWDNQHFFADAEHAAAAALKAGIDLSCWGDFQTLTLAVRDGLVSEADVDRALHRVLAARFRLGMFDPPAVVPFSKFGANDIDRPAARVLAERAAAESIVLLKNERNLLPLDTHKIHRIAVIGPVADSIDVLNGNYNGTASSYVTILSGLRREAQSRGIGVTYAAGATPPKLATDFRGSLEAPAESAAQAYVIVPPGDDITYEKTGIRADLSRGAVVAEIVGHQPKAANAQMGVVVLAASNEHPHFADASGYLLVNINGGLFIYKSSGAGGLKQLAYAPASTSPADAADHRLVAVASYDGSSTVTLSLLWDNDPILTVNDNSSPYTAGYYGLRTIYTVPNILGISNFRQSSADAAAILSPKRAKFSGVKASTAAISAAVDAAKSADVVIMALGYSPKLEGEEGEGGDRTTFALPGNQELLAQAVSRAGKPIVLVLTGGSVVSSSWASKNIPAILMAWYGGEEGGTAVAKTIFGENNPSGKLPLTFFRSVNQLPAFTDYSMRGRTYRYFAGTPLYRFGYGLSYSSFKYILRRVTQSRGGAGCDISVAVKNVGRAIGDAVVELYVKKPATPLDPLPTFSDLVAFRRVTTTPGAGTDVRFLVGRDGLAEFSAEGRPFITPGKYEFAIGGSSPEPGFKYGVGEGVEFSVTVDSNGRIRC